MANPPTRSILGKIFKNFINSFKLVAPQHRSGKLIGTDYFGNKYFEIAANPELGRRRPSRWFEPVEKDDFQQEMPAEWEAWLRGRRKEPPQEEEILKNVAIMQMKKRNALALTEKYRKPEETDLVPTQNKGVESFPKYDEYEFSPGDRAKKY